MIRQSKTLFQLPSISMGRYDWTITVYADSGEVHLLPEWRLPGSGWMTPADLKEGKMPIGAVGALLTRDHILKLADVIRAAQKP